MAMSQCEHSCGAPRYLAHSTRCYIVIILAKLIQITLPFFSNHYTD